MESGWIYASLVAASGLLVAARAYVLAVWRQAASRVIVTSRCSDELAAAVQFYLMKECRPSRFGPRSYSAWKSYLPRLHRVEIVPYETIDQSPRLFWFGRVPIFVKADGGQQVNGVDSSRSTWSVGLSLTSIRGLISLETFVISASKFYNDQYAKSMERRHRIVEMVSMGSSGWSANDDKKSQPSVMGSSSVTDVIALACQRLLIHSPADLTDEQVDKSIEKTFDGLIMTQEMIALRDRFQWWQSRRTWYDERRLAWKDGWLLYGPPGTGKTSTIRSIARYYDLPIFTTNLQKSTDWHLKQLFAQASQNSPSIVLLEDIDAVFEGRELKAKHMTMDGRMDGITFEGFLNCLDGAQQNHGVVVAMTTNHIEKLDPALIRAGRMNVKIECGLFNRDQQQRLTEFLLGDLSSEVELRDAWSPAEVAAECIQLLVKHTAEKFHGNAKTGERFADQCYHLVSANGSCAESEVGCGG